MLWFFSSKSDRSSNDEARFSLWCQTEGQIPPRDFFSHALNIWGIPPLLGSLASQVFNRAKKNNTRRFDARLSSDVCVIVG